MLRAVHGVAKSRTRLSDWTGLNVYACRKPQAEQSKKLGIARGTGLNRHPGAQEDPPAVG